MYIHIILYVPAEIIALKPFLKPDHLVVKFDLNTIAISSDVDIKLALGVS